MKLLLDQGLPRGAATLLSRHGHDAVHVADIGFGDATDEEILMRAVADNRTVITLDADFHSIIAVAGADRPSVIRIRIEGLRAQELTAVVQPAIAQFNEALVAGALITIDPAAVRMRRLPIQPSPGPTRA